MEPSNLLPRIDPLRCTGCGRCVDRCPTQALSQINNKASLSAPEKCIFCDVCEDICPEQAIALPFQVFFASSSRKAKTETAPD